jgi:hypothetical protein
LTFPHTFIAHLIRYRIISWNLTIFGSLLNQLYQMKYINTVIFLFLFCIHSFAQLWEYPYNNLDYTDFKNQKKESKKGIKVEKVTTKDFQQEHTDYFGYDSLGRIVFELSDLADTIWYTYNSDDLWITNGFGDKINTRELNYDEKFNLISIQTKFSNGSQSIKKFEYDSVNNLTLVYMDSLNKTELSYYSNSKVKEIRKTINNDFSKKTEVFKFKYNADTVFYSKCYFYENQANLNSCTDVYGVYNEKDQIIKIVSKSTIGTTNYVYTSDATYNQSNKLVKVVNHYETGSKDTILYQYNEEQFLIKIEQYTDEDLQSEIFYEILE